MAGVLRVVLLLWVLQVSTRVSAQDSEYDHLLVRPRNINDQKDNCPINVYFAMDTSESVALREFPWGSLVEELKVFLQMFVERLQTTTLRAKRVQWAYGGLHFSDRVEVFSQVVTDAAVFLGRAQAIRYIGRGTFIDCALRNMTEQVRLAARGKPRLQYAVVLTDGHITGSPCGGVSQAAEAAKAAGIKIFVVATNEETMESELKQIVSSPVELYRKDYMAFPASNRQAAVIRITDTMIKETEFECQAPMCIQTEGAAGPKGYKGMKGDLGIEGPIGLHGLKGKTGTIGSPGCKGDAGMPVEWWSQRYRDSETLPIPAMERLIQWLPLHLPKHQRSTLIHGSFRLENLVFHPEKPEVVAVLDWGRSNLGDPLSDLTFSCMARCLPQDNPLLTGISDKGLEQLGIPSVEEVIGQYSSSMGLEEGVPDWQFYMAFHLFCLAASHQGESKNTIAGQTGSGKIAEQVADLAWDFATKEGFRIFNAKPSAPRAGTSPLKGQIAGLPELSCSSTIPSRSPGQRAPRATASARKCHPSLGWAGSPLVVDELKLIGGCRASTVT
ncbi:hypothetical protein J4Q44_G00027850 [Coregonus suidteri]|uniref:VWFA domain-containing protein n=1 Tax=Coregonus suidteri TaxID=861788 RepID=A0AAN8R4V9_9TELE